jgi:hemolysin III
MHKKLTSHLREPFNALSHLIGAAASFAGLLLLIYLTWGETGKMISLIIYALSMTILFSASTLLHGTKLSESGRTRLNRLDHAAIFLLIVGTYTPIIYNLFPAGWRWPTLICYWLVAVSGMIYKVFSPKIHNAFNKIIYPLLSWGGVVPAVLASINGLILPVSGLALVAIGGIIYTIGFIIYFRERPDPWPGVFGHHEIWHVFVLMANVCHFLFMLLFIVPA